TAVRSDASNLGDLDRLFAQVKREKGRLDVVFANAGTAQLAPLEKITEEHFDAIFGVNVKGVVFTVQKALPLLPDGASVILNASIVATKGWPQWSVYSATKAALRSFARTWAADLKDRGIRVNAVSPGITDTLGLNELMVASGAGDQALKRLPAASRLPTGRLKSPSCRRVLPPARPCSLPPSVARSAMPSRSWRARRARRRRFRRRPAL